MNLRVYNTLTKTKEPFETIRRGEVGIYLCGPTVYKPSHIGHAVGPIIFDAIKRYLVFRGYEVTWVPSMRMIVDLADLDRSRWINLAGESGHAFSDHYTDQTEFWRTGRTTAMRCRPATIRREARYVQKMRS